MPSTGPGTSMNVLTSWRTNCRPRWCSRWARLAGAPVIRLSMPTTVCPSASSRSQRWLPRNPAAPVTRRRMPGGGRYCRRWRRALADVVSRGLEREAPYGNRPTAPGAVELPPQLLEHHPLLAFVRPLHRHENSERHLVVGARADQRLDVLRKTGAPVARAREQ